MKYDNYTKHQKAELELLDKKLDLMCQTRKAYEELDPCYDETDDGKLLEATISNLFTRHTLLNHLYNTRYKLKLERETISSNQ